MPNSLGEGRRSLSRRRVGTAVASAAALTVAGLWAAGPVLAVAPGQPGEIAFSSNRIGPEDTTIDPETEAPFSDFDIFITRPFVEPINLTANSVALVEPEEGGEPEPVPIDDLHPAVSPEGTRVAFTSNRPDAADGSTDPDIYVMNIDGTGIVQITANRPGMGSGGMGAAEYEPAWSPDGTRLAYRLDDGRNADIWIVDLATKEATRMTGSATGPGGYDAEPAWSPDGTKIAFVTGKGPSAQINVVDVATKTISSLIDAPDVSDASPSWSPDGTKIVYRRGDEGAGGAIWSAPVSGGPGTALTDPFGGVEPPEGEDGEPAAYSDLNPVWSPDGLRIAFQSTRPDEGEEIAGDPDLYVMNADGSGQERLLASSVDVVELPAPEPEPEEPEPEEPGEGGPALPNSDITPDWQTIPFARTLGTPPSQCATPPTRGTPNEVAAPEQITASYLRINQRTGAAAVRRANAIDAWLDAGIVNEDLCGGALSPEDLDSGLTVVLKPPTTTPPTPSPRKVTIPKAKVKDATFTANAIQMCINQRIYQAGIVRANALKARIDGQLTGGDVKDGIVTQDRLRSDLMIVAGTANPSPPPASTTDLTKPTRQGCTTVSFTPRQAAINRRIAIQSVVRINRVLDQLATGLTGTHFKDRSITKVDFAAGVAP